MSVTPRRFIVLAAALALLPAAAHAATRPDWASGRSAAEVRAMEARLARTEAERDRIAARHGLTRQTLNAIAGEVGMGNPRFTDGQLIDAVEAMALKARDLLSENRRLKTDLAALSDPALRDPALAALGRAETAIAEGRLADAEAEYARVKDMRWGESDAARAAWDSAVEAEARTAELRQLVEKAQNLRLAAADRWLEMEKHARRQAFIVANTAAGRRLMEGETFGRLETIAAAIALYEKRVLPMVPRDQYPDLWGGAQINLGNALASLGGHGGEDALALLNKAVLCYDLALAVFDRNAKPADWALTQNNLGNALQELGMRQSGRAGEVLRNRAIAAFEAALEVRTRVAMPAEWAQTRENLGLAHEEVSGLNSGMARLPHLRAAAAAFVDALTVYTPSEMPLDYRRATGSLTHVRAALAELEGK